MMIEWILQDFATAYGLKFVSLRYFNAAGADPDAEIGEDHDPETHLIPLVLDAAFGRRNCLEIYGTDYDTPDEPALETILMFQILPMRICWHWNTSKTADRVMYLIWATAKGFLSMK